MNALQGMDRYWKEVIQVSTQNSKICYFFAFFMLFSPKTLKIIIMTSIWGAQHPKAGRNIQHSFDLRAKLDLRSTKFFSNVDLMK